MSDRYRLTTADGKVIEAQAGHTYCVDPNGLWVFPAILLRGERVASERRYVELFAALGFRPVEKGADENER